MKKVCIVGTGIAGSSLAFFLSKTHEVHMFEQKDHIGGLSTTFSNIENLQYQLGSHVLHTSDEWIIELFSQFVELQIIDFSVAINPLFDFRYYTFPFSEESIDSMPWHWRESIKLELQKTTGDNASNLEKLIINFYGETAYKIFFNYLVKIFGCKLSNLDDVDWYRKLLRPLSADKYYNDKWVAFPKGGYKSFFEALTKKTKIFLNQKVTLNDVKDYDVIVCTGRPDEFVGFDKKLEYVCSTFEIDTSEYAENKPDLMIFPNYTPYVTMNQFGKFFNQKEKNIIVREHCKDIGEYTTYPIPKIKYTQIFKNIKNSYSDIFFIGRIGSYQFLDMADCIKQAAVTAAQIKAREQ